MTIRKILISLSLIALFIPIIACNSGKEVMNRKMDRSLNQLVQLVQAGKLEEAEAFASQGGLKLKDGNVKVSVYFASGQGEVAAKAVTDAGGELTSTYNSGVLFDAWIPVTKLESVANEKSISYIEQIDPGVPLD